MGGAEGVRRLVACFFRQMEERPSAARIRAMHGPDLEAIARKLTSFLDGYLGGSAGHGPASILDLAHFRFSIGAPERDEWLGCMRAALVEAGVDEAVAAALLDDLFLLADRFRSDTDSF